MKVKSGHVPFFVKNECQLTARKAGVFSLIQFFTTKKTQDNMTLIAK